MSLFLFFFFVAIYDAIDLLHQLLSGREQPFDFMLSWCPSSKCFSEMHQNGFFPSSAQSALVHLDVMGVLTLGVAKLLQICVMQSCIFAMSLVGL